MADLTAEEARRLTDRIIGQISDVLPAIREAFERHAWKALGHASWDAYCDAELRGLRLPVAQRQEAARELVGSGMSRRSAAAALGVGATTVRRDLADAQPRRNAAVEAPAPASTGANASVDGSSTASRSTAPNGAVDDTEHPQLERNVPVESGPAMPHVPRAAPPAATEAAPAPVRPTTVLGADGRRRQMPPAPPKRPVDLADTPEGRAAATRNAVRKGVQAFLPVVSDLTPQRVAEVADEELWLELGHCRDRFIQWTDEIFAIRRRQSMHVVPEEAV